MVMRKSKKANGGTGEALTILVTANSELASGIARAISDGFTEFSNAMEDGDPTKPGFDNPILKGSLTGSLKAMDTSLDSIRSVLKILFNLS
jgi:hypothetical protein